MTLPTDPHFDNSPRAYFDRFFEEKEIPFTTWEIEAGDTVHLLDSEVVIEAIKGTRGDEAKKIQATLRKIDFHNGDVLHFLRHLAGALAHGYGANR